MTTFTGQTKSSLIILTPLAKSSITAGKIAKAGAGWQYNQPGFLYDGPTDLTTGLPINYDEIGNLPIWTPLPKS